MVAMVGVRTPGDKRADRAPAVSVVVATHDRAGLLPQLFAGLAAQDVGATFEVIIVDDASSDDTGAVLARLAGEAHARAETDATFTTKLVRFDRNRGPASARNAGWKLARADVVAFTDDDCTPDPTWLTGLLAMMDEADVVQGTTVPDGPAKGPWSHTMDVRTPSGSYETCNIAYRRALLDELGGFDERYRGCSFGEDFDLGIRAVGAGARFAFTEKGVVRHVVTPSSWVAHVRGARRLDGMGRAVRDNPRIRDKLHRRVFYKPAHPKALLAATGTALLLARPSRRRLVLAIGLAAPYIWHRAGQAPFPGKKYTWPWVQPMGLVADLAEIGILVRASVRYRTLVL
jgi:glycosyltransferase involved in cell wall biosynthesis